MNRLLILLVSLACFGFAQSSGVALPTYIVGAGVTGFNPGLTGTVDIDYHASGVYYAHIAIGNITVKSGQLFATFRPGAEARIFTASSGLAGLTLEGDAGLALGTAATLSSFTGGGYVWFDLCQTVKALQKLGSCYLELGGAIAAGTLVSTTQAQPVQLIPSFKFRWGAR